MKITRRQLILLSIVLFLGIAEANTLKDNPPTIFYPAGHYLDGWPRKAGRDMFGYNYQTHKFTGFFANVYLGGDGLPPYRGNGKKYYQALVDYGFAPSVEAAETYLSEMWYWELRDVRMYMRWNDAWLSNQDRGDDNLGMVPDGNLDRHYGYPNYFDSEAVLTQFQVERIKVDCGKRTKTVFLYYWSKITAVPSTAVLVDGIWFSEEGEELGEQVFGSFARKSFLYDPLEHGDPCHKGAWRKDRCEQVRPDCKSNEHEWKKDKKDEPKKDDTKKEARKNRRRGRR